MSTPTFPASLNSKTTIRTIILVNLGVKRGKRFVFKWSKTKPIGTHHQVYPRKSIAFAFIYFNLIMPNLIDAIGPFHAVCHICYRGIRRQVPVCIFPYVALRPQPFFIVWEVLFSDLNTKNVHVTFPLKVHSYFKMKHIP